jgi:hypothetical protein
MNQSTIETLRLSRIRLMHREAGYEEPRLRLMLNQIIDEIPHMSDISPSAWIQIEAGKVIVCANIVGAGIAYELQVTQDTPGGLQRYSDIQMTLSRGASDMGDTLYYGPAGLVIELGTCRLYTKQGRRQIEPLRVVPKSLPSPAMEVTMTIKTFRRMLNGVAKTNNRVFTLASHNERWNVFSETPTTVGTRWRITPTIYSSAIGGVKYKTLYDFFFRKKRTVRGILSDFDENREITLCLRDNGELVVYYKINENRQESFTFEPDASIMGLLDLLDNPDFELPFKGRVATVTEEPKEVTTVITEEPTEEVEELVQESVSFSKEEADRMSEWSQASMRHQQEVGAPISESPQIWFSHYMMERLRQGEAIDDLDNQILAKL